MEKKKAGWALATLRIFRIDKKIIIISGEGGKDSAPRTSPISVVERVGNSLALFVSLPPKKKRT